MNTLPIMIDIHFKQFLRLFKFNLTEKKPFVQILTSEDHVYFV